jgi:hypothetical protein
MIPPTRPCDAMSRPLNLLIAGNFGFPAAVAIFVIAPSFGSTRFYSVWTARSYFDRHFGLVFTRAAAPGKAMLLIAF